MESDRRSSSERGSVANFGLLGPRLRGDTTSNVASGLYFTHSSHAELAGSSPPSLSRCVSTPPAYLYMAMPLHVYIYM